MRTIPMGKTIPPFATSHHLTNYLCPNKSVFKMKNPILVLSIFGLATLFGCQNDPQPVAENLLVIETVTTERNEGDCATPDAPCAHILLKYPTVKTGPDTLKQSIDRWANDFLVAMLDPAVEADDEVTLTAAMDEFVLMHQELVAEMPDLPSRYEVEVTDTILLQDSAHLTLLLDAYSYTGGAHPNAFAAVATFDVKTGRILRPEDLVKDVAKLEALAEKRFREVRKEDFDDGFDFDETFPFKLADNVGLTTEGLFFCYIPYEVGPYAMGFTEFVIPFDELKGIIK